MIAEAIPDASARVFVAERKATASAAAATAAAAAGTTRTPSKTPPPPAPASCPVSASFARNNPWTDLSSPMDTRQRLLMLCCVPLLLWRLFLTALILPCVHLTFYALVAGQDFDSPLSPLRARCTNALLRFWSGGLLFLAFGVLPRIKNERSEWDEIVREANAQRAVVVFNHVSYLDGLVIVSLLQPCCAAKKEVASMPFFGVWTRALQFLFIERRGARKGGGSESESGRGSEKSAPCPAASGEGAAAAMARRAADARFPLLAVSPEGTTKSRHCLLRFKSGAFVSGRPVLPICLNYRRRRRRSKGGSAAAASSSRSSDGGGGGGGGGEKGKRPSRSLLWLADALIGSVSNFNPGWGLLQNDGFHVLRAYMSPWTPLSVEALPVMGPLHGGGGGGEGDGGKGGETPPAAGSETPAKFAERVRRAMAAALEAPLVDLGVEDWARLKAAGVAVDPTGTKVLWRPAGPGTERVEVAEEGEAARKEA